MLTRVLALLGLLAVASGCARLLTPLGGGVPVGGASLSVGEWSGTTAQGMPIAFTVGANETITTLTTYRAFGYSNGSPATGPYTQINGLFLPGGQARGQAVFSAYPNCGTPPPVEWTATKR
jgi:hypothetical protein